MGDLPDFTGCMLPLKDAYHDGTETCTHIHPPSLKQ